MEAFVFIGAIILIIIFLSNKVNSGNAFRDGSNKITVGMTTQDVIAIMGQPSFTKNYIDGSFEYVYEKSEWKGMLRGGTATRRMEIVFSADSKVISIGKNNNCDRSGW